MSYDHPIPGPLGHNYPPPEYRWDWIEDEQLPHRGTYAVVRGSEVVCTTNGEKNGYERALEIAAAMNARADA